MTTDAKRGRIKARCWVIRRDDAGGRWYLAEWGRWTLFGLNAAEYPTAASCRTLAEVKGGKVYRRGRRSPVAGGGAG